VRGGDGGDSGLPHVVSVIRSRFCDESCVVSSGLVDLPRTWLIKKPAPVEDVWLGNRICAALLLQPVRRPSFADASRLFEVVRRVLGGGATT
jgi:hypothetical protein